MSGIGTAISGIGTAIWYSKKQGSRGTTFTNLKRQTYQLCQLRADPRWVSSMSILACSSEFFTTLVQKMVGGVKGGANVCANVDNMVAQGSCTNCPGKGYL